MSTQAHQTRPTKARAHWCDDSVLLVVLEETLAPVEGYDGPSRIERAEP